MPILVMGESGAPSFGNDVTDTVPIDAGLSLLVVAGLGYGTKKMKERKVATLNKN